MTLPFSIAHLVLIILLNVKISIFIKYFIKKGNELKEAEYALSLLAGGVKDFLGKPEI